VSSAGLHEGSVSLRPWNESDAEAVYEACQDPEIQHWIPVIPRPYTREDAVAFVTGALKLGPYQFAIVENGKSPVRSAWA
jgi:RimJ/RimL family protein N-acetyltransferase